MSISRLKCLNGGINSERIPLSERAVLHISLDTSKYEASPSKLTPTLTKRLSGVKVKHILGDNESSILFLKPLLFFFFQIWNCPWLWNIDWRSSWRKCSRDRCIAFLQQMLYINMSHSHIMWWYYRQYIALWGMVRLLINVFDHVSHYCHHMWSSTWRMRLSLYMGIKERSIHCAP